MTAASAPYLAAFEELSSGRGYVASMGGAAPLRISVQERESFARVYGFDRSRQALEDFVTLIGWLDQDFLAHFDVKTGSVVLTAAEDDEETERNGG